MTPADVLAILRQTTAGDVLAALSLMGLCAAMMWALPIVHAMMEGL